MRGKSAKTALALVLLAGAALLMVSDRDVFRALVMACGIVFVCAGIVNVILYIGTDRAKVYRDGTIRRRRPMTAIIFGWISSLGCIFLGIAMLLSPESFVRFLPYLMAVMLFFGALVHVCLIVSGVRRRGRLQAWLFLFPLLELIGGVMVAAMSLTQQAVLLVTGIGLILFSAGCLAFQAALKPKASASCSTDEAASNAPASPAATGKIVSLDGGDEDEDDEFFKL